MKTVAFGFLILGLVACSNSGKRSTTTITIPRSTFETQKEQLKNDSVSGMDILMARMQGVPIPALGTSYKNVVLTIEKNDLQIVSKTEKHIIVFGSSKPIKNTKKIIEGKELSAKAVVTETEVSIENPDHFEFKFEKQSLSSGPNLVKVNN